MGRGKAEAVAGAPQADGVLPKSKTSGGAARSGEFAQVRRQGPLERAFWLEDEVVAAETQSSNCHPNTPAKERVV